MKPFSKTRIALLAAPVAIVALALTVNPFKISAQNNASAAGSPAQSSPASQPSDSILPTAVDKQLALQITSLVIELDKPPSLGREIVNNTRSAEAIGFIQALQSETPVSTRTLARARRYARGVLPQLEELRDLKAPVPSYVVLKRSPITIDGKLDEPTWKRAVEIPIQFQKSEKTPEVKAKARLLWDAQFLYVGFEVLDTNIIAPVIARDGDVWRNDCVEMFLMPSQRFGTYWEIELSPTGSILDYLCYKYPNQWGSDFHTAETVQGLQVASVIRGTANKTDDRDEGYTIEVAVPFDQLPGMQKGAGKGDRIRALLGWVNNDSGASNNATTSLAQVPYAGWFHNVWSYQPFKLVSKIPKPTTK